MCSWKHCKIVYRTESTSFLNWRHLRARSKIYRETQYFAQTGFWNLDLISSNKYIVYFWSWAPHFPPPSPSPVDFKSKRGKNDKKKIKRRHYGNKSPIPGIELAISISLMPDFVSLFSPLFWQNLQTDFADFK